VHFAVLTDLHLTPDLSRPGRWLGEYDRAGVPERLEQALELAAAADPSLLPLGDVSEDGDERIAAGVIERCLAAGLTPVVVWGNHDASSSDPPSVSRAASAYAVLSALVSIARGAEGFVGKLILVASTDGAPEGIDVPVVVSTSRSSAADPGSSRLRFPTRATSRIARTSSTRSARSRGRRWSSAVISTSAIRSLRGRCCSCAAARSWRRRTTSRWSRSTATHVTSTCSAYP
jgi:hypothetical protein